MALEANKEAVRRWFEEGIGSNDENTARDVADQIFTEDFVDGDGQDPPRGRDEFKRRVVSSVFRTFSDIRVTVEDVVAEGDVVAARLRFSGIQRGDFRGHPATGGRIEFTETGLSFFRDGRIYASKGDISNYRLLA
jgi:predicted ester cyclase